MFLKKEHFFVVVKMAAKIFFLFKVRGADSLVSTQNTITSCVTLHLSIEKRIRRKPLSLTLEPVGDQKD